MWVAAAIVAVLVLGVIGYRWLGGVSDREGKTAAAQCVRGDLTVHVAVDPAIDEPLAKTALAFNATRTVADDYCVKIDVTGVPSTTAMAGLVGTWDKRYGERPALWVPSSSTWAARLKTSKATAVAGNPTPLVSSPVVLAVPTDLRKPLDGVRWIDVPGLQAADGLDSRAEGWGALRMALPTGASSDGTYLAAQSIAAAVTHTSAGPIADAAARGPQVGTTLARLASAAPTPRAPTADAALTVLAGEGDAKAGPIHAVPVIEQQLFAYLQTHPGAKLAAVSPSGATATATYPAVALGDGVDEAHSQAAAEFVSFLGTGDHAKELAAAGFRAPNQPTPRATDAVPFGRFEPLPTPSESALTAIADAVTAE